MRFFLLLGVMAALCVGITAGCGQKGPLYMSDNPPPGSQPSATKAYKPVPYPERPEDKRPEDK
jgi:predicted small lipoprotein YifL